LRAVVFIVFASAYWALMPLIARDRLGGGAELYGLLVACIGAGAVIGAALLPRVRASFEPGSVVIGSTTATALVLLAFALTGQTALAAMASVVAGASWIAAQSTFNISTQMSLPDWVRARGLAVYSAAFFGSMAAGSVLWGQLAGLFGIPAALLLAAGGALICMLPVARFPLQAGGALNLSPSSHWQQPVLAGPADADQGPVMITTEYRVNSAHAHEFLEALTALADHASNISSLFLKKIKFPIIIYSLAYSIVKYIYLNKGIRIDDFSHINTKKFKELFRSSMDICRGP
jgi:MFS family permease